MAICRTNDAFASGNVVANQYLLALHISLLSYSRRNGRPGYPPVVMFRAFSLKYLLERALHHRAHRASAFVRAPARVMWVRRRRAVPDSTYSRFFSRLRRVDGLAERAMTEMVERVKERLPDVGECVAVDFTDIRAYAHPTREGVDTDTAWGYRTRKARSRSKSASESFFGYKLHSIYESACPRYGQAV